MEGSGEDLRPNAGIAAPATVQGRDFIALLDDTNKKLHEAAYNRFLNADAVITDQFSYTSLDNGKVQMLYELTKDPQENKNIAEARRNKSQS